MDHKMEKKKRKVIWPQWIAGTGVTLSLIQVGIMGAWSSPYIAYLTSSNSHIPITMDEASWIVSLLNLGRPVGAILGSVAVNYFGTKTTILVSSLPMTFSWLFIMLADRAEWLYVARFLSGIGIGKSYSSFSLYLSEIADPTIRGALVFLAVSGLSIGNLMICIMGANLNMEISASICLALCFILMIIFLWLPESPHHLVKINAEEKARASMLWYHRDCDVESELQTLKKFIEINNSLSFMNVLKEFRIPHIWKALVLVLVLFMYSQMSGLNNVVFYMESILRSADVTVIDPSTVVIIVTAFGIASSLLFMLLIDKFGRRILMIASSTNVAISLICLGTTFQFLNAGYNSDDLQALAIFSMFFFELAVFSGIISIPTTIMGEIFPPQIKCMAGCLTNVMAGIYAFISTSTYQPLINLITEKYVFYIYSLLLLTAVPFTLFCMPETKGKSLQEIQEELLTKKS